MLKFILDIKKANKEIENLRIENNRLRKSHDDIVDKNNNDIKILRDLIDSRSDFQLAIEKKLGHEVEFYNYKDLPANEKNSHCLEIDKIVHSKSFQNEYNNFINNLVWDAGLKCSLEDVTFLRASVNGVMAFVEHLQSVEKIKLGSQEENIDESGYSM